MTIKREKMCVVADKKHPYNKKEDKEAHELADDNLFWEGGRYD